MARNVAGLARSLAGLARIVPAIAPELAVRFNARLERGFAEGVDPYGGAWAALKPSTIKRWKRSPPPLTATGALRAASKVVAQGLTLVFSDGPSYGRFHMSGTEHMAKRRYYPDAGLPASWREDIREVYRDKLEVFGFPGAQ